MSRTGDPVDDVAIWRAARSAFLHMIDQPATARAAHLATLSPSVRAAAARLLDADDAEAHTAAGVLHQPPGIDALRDALLAHDEAPFTPLAPGQSLGAYRIAGEIGRGGGGVVYRATRAVDGTAQHVAIKVLASAPTRAARARFRRERQILATLEHPSIARLIDVGETPEDRPYVVMELVDGVPITAYAAARALSDADRVALFLRVCDAVAIAHRALVVHRDLKPSNILVDARGTPKLLDFGIAAQLTALPDAAAPDAARAERWGSPGYSSPEQIAGGSITTASDVYSLGVLLFELLVGARPAVDRSGTSSAPPSAAAARASAGGGRRRLHADLDAIVTKALQAAPDARYASVEALADDLRRQRDRLPVRARRSTGRYRLRRFVDRHRLASAAGLAVGLVLLLALLQAQIQAQRLARERDAAARAQRTAEAVSATLIDVVSVIGPAGGQAYSDTLRSALDRSTTRTLDRLRELDAPRASALTALGGVYRDLAHYDEAERLLRRAVAIRRDGSDPIGLAASLDALGRSRGQQHADDAEAILEEALALRRTHLPATDVGIADSLAALARVVQNRGRIEEAERLLREAVAIDRRGDAERRPTSVDRLHALGTLMLYREQPAQSEALLRRALAASRRLFGDRHLHTGRALNALGALVGVMRATDLVEGERLLREALEVNRALLGDRHPQLATTYSNLGALLIGQARFDEAVPLLDAALAIDLERLGPDHPHTAIDRVNLAWALWQSGSPARAVEQLTQALASRERTLVADHPDIAAVHGTLGLIALETGDVATARVRFTTAMRLQRARFGDAHWTVADTELNLAWVALVAGDDLDRAYRRATRARAQLASAALDPSESFRLPAADTVLGMLQIRRGHVAEGERLLRAGHAVLCAHPPPGLYTLRRSRAWMRARFGPQAADADCS
ncbi:MAG: serine/threonine-protein kinase [Acidobacteriota bacterium]